MKKYVYLILSILIISAVSCKKKDTTAPMIFLEGDTEPYRIIVGTWFVDPGISANDNVDGKDIQSKVTLVHDVPGLPEEATRVAELEGKVTTTGDYTITYSVTDDAGNTSTAVRQVQVYNEAEKYAIDYYYTKTSNQGVISADVVESQYVQMTPSADSKTNWRLKFSKLSNISGLAAYVDISKNSSDPQHIKYEIDIPYQEFTIGNFEYRIQGTGEITDTLFYTIRLDYSIDRDNTSTGGSLVDDVVEIYKRI